MVILRTADKGCLRHPTMCNPAERNKSMYFFSLAGNKVSKWKPARSAGDRLSIIKYSKYSAGGRYHPWVKPLKKKRELVKINTLACVDFVFPLTRLQKVCQQQQARITIAIYGRLRGTVHPSPYRKILLRGPDGTVTGAVYTASMRPFYGNGVQPYAFETSAALSYIKRGSATSIANVPLFPIGRTNRWPEHGT
ncbi:hypothetical protein DFH09DRAFT_1088802 [Mycena vulgaris]|nr:hypothetical protein DFH09DRAFT_1088802 [Mycena vulgaris]